MEFAQSFKPTEGRQAPLVALHFILQCAGVIL